MELIKVLLLEDEEAHAEAIRRALGPPPGRFAVKVAGTLKEYRESVAAGPPDIAVLDMILPDGRCLELLDSPLETRPFPVLIMTSRGDERTAVEAMKAGALDYFVKSPEAFADMPHKLDHALEHWQLLSERGLALDALSESEGKYRNVVEKASEAIIIAQDGVFVFANKRTSELLGVPDGSLEGKPFIDFVWPEDRELIISNYKRRIAGEPIPDAYEFRIVGAGGRLTWVFLSATAIQWKGRPATLQLMTDVTERRKAQELQRVSEERYRTVVENANEVIMVAQDGMVKFANRKMEELSGYSREELLSMVFIEFVHPDDRQFMVESEFRRLSGDRFIVERPVRMINRQGDVIWMEVSAVVIEWEGRHATLNFVSDITGRRKSEEELRQSEERYRSLIDGALEAVVVIQDGLILYANPRAFEIMDYPRDQKEPRPFADLIHPDDRATVIDRHARRLKGEEIESAYPIRLMDRRGSSRWVQISTSLINWQGKPATLTFLADISENKRAERALEIQRDLGIQLSEAEDLHKSLPSCLEAAIELSGMDSGGIYLADAGTGDLLLVCSSGLSPEFTESASRFPKSSANAQLAMTGKPQYMQYGDSSLVTDDAGRSEGLKSIAFVPVKIGNRLIACVNVASHSEIGIPVSARNALEAIASKIGGAVDRLRARDVLRESEEQYRLLIENSHDIIYTLDLQGVFLFVSPSWKQILGHDNYAVVGHQFQEFVHPDDIPRCEKFMESVLQTAELLPGIEYRVRNVEGEWKWHNTNAAPIINADGTCTSFVGIASDITDHKRLEEERQRVEKLESIGLLAGGIAHDFNNILTSILGNISLAGMDAAPDSELQHSLDQAEKASLRAKDLAVQLLTFSKGGAPVKKITGLTEVLRDAVSFAVHGSNVKCRFSISADLWHAEVDEGQVSQVIHNLVVNAQQSMPDGGTIEISARNIDLDADQSLGRSLPLKAGHYVRIAVADRGCGIPADHLDRIFDPFFTTKKMGSGLGLATSFSIARQHGGHISVTSVVGSGSTFYLYLPASVETAARKPDKQDVIKTAGKARILVMDDEEGVRDIAGRMLKHLGYNDVEFAAEGAVAIKLYKAAMRSGNPFDVVMLDLTIAGGMGGEAAIKKLIKIDPAVRAIVSSGYIDDSVISKYREHGFGGVVAKPYSLEQLQKALNDVMG